MTDIAYRPLRAHKAANQTVFILGTIALLLALLFGAKVAGELAGSSDPATTPTVLLRAQVPPPKIDLPVDPNELKLFAATTPATSAPIVLAYHDIAPEPKSRYTVTPHDFAAQMATLSAAGFHSLSAADLRGNGGAVPTLPGRSVLITFDDGAAGLWRYADPILQRYRMHGVAFVITSDVTTRRPSYYLSWSELQRMQRSGRWDVESHSDDGHGLVSAGPRHAPGPYFVTRQWLPAQARFETLKQFRARISADLARVDRRLAAHGLPQATLFAHPRSADLNATNDRNALVVLQSVLDERYDASFSNRDLAAPLVGALQGHALPRMEIVGADHPADVWARVRRSTPAPVVSADALANSDAWADDAGRSVTQFAEDHRVPVGATATFGRVHYLPGSSTLWSAYRVTTTIAGLGTSGSELSAGVSVLEGSARPIRIDLSNRVVRITRGSDGGPEVLANRPVPNADSHELSVVVDRGSVVVTVDGRRTATIAPDGASPVPTGGLGVQSWRSAGSLLFPQFATLNVSPVPGTA